MCGKLSGDMTKFMRHSLLTATVLAFVLTSGSYAQNIPAVKGKALDDSEVVLPKPGSQQYLILTIGFSHKSGEQSSAWGKRLFADYSSNARVAVYQFAELEAAPSIIRGMIVHGMRKDIPAAQHAHFVPMYDHEEDWKKTVKFSALDDAYVLLTTPDGHVLWQTHGAISDAAYAELKSAVANAGANPQKSSP